MLTCSQFVSWTLRTSLRRRVCTGHLEKGGWPLQGVAVSPWACRAWLLLALTNGHPGRRRLPCSLLGIFTSRHLQPSALEGRCQVTQHRWSRGRPGGPMMSEAGGGVHCPCHIKDFSWPLLCFSTVVLSQKSLVLSYFISAIYAEIELVVEGHTSHSTEHLGAGPPFLRAAGFFPSPLTDGNSLFDSMASGMRLIVSCISSFLILSLLLFMVHRLRQRRRERIESLIGANCECSGPCL